MARTAPVPNIPAPPGMNPGAFVAGGGGDGGGKGGKGKKGGGGDESADGADDDADASGDGNDGGEGCGDPVCPITGRVFLDVYDFGFAAPHALRWIRSYNSRTSHLESELGWGWSHPYAYRLRTRRRKVVVVDALGREQLLDHPKGSAPTPTALGWLYTVHAGVHRLKLSDGSSLSFGAEKANGWRYAETFVDRNGNATHVKRDERGHLVELVDSAGRHYRVTTSELGRILRVSVALNAEANSWLDVARYAYDAQGQLIAATDAEGFSAGYHYAKNLLIEHRTVSGLSYKYRYDGDTSSAYCIETWGEYPHADPALEEPIQPAREGQPDTRKPKGIHYVAFVYSKDDRYCEAENGLGGITRYFGDAMGRVLRRVDASGGVTDFEFHTECSDQVAVVAPDGGVRRVERGELGTPRSVFLPDGRRIDYEDDADGFRVRHDRANSSRLKRYFDDHNNLTLLVHPDESRESFEYDSRGLLSRHGARNGSTASYTHDAMGNCVEIVDANGQRTRQEFDYLGRRTALIAADGVRTEWEYDRRSEVTRRSRGGGTLTEVRYDANRRPTHVDTGGRLTRLEWGGMAWLTAVIGPDGNRTEYRYDVEGNLVRITNGRGQVYRQHFDLASQCIAVETFEGIQHRAGYDLSGQAVWLENPDGREVRQYASGGALELAELADGQVIELLRDIDTLRISNGVVETELKRDAAGRTLRDRQGEHENRVEWSGSEVTRITSDRGPDLEFSRRFNGRAESLECGSARIVFNQTAGRDVISYLGSQLAVRKHFTPSGRVAYLGLSRMTPTAKLDSVGLPSDPQLIASRSFRYDSTQTLVEEVRDQQTLVEYELNALRQVVKRRVQRNGQQLEEERLAYDAAGSPRLTGVGYDAVFRPVSHGADNLKYDACGRLCERISDAGVWRYTWGASGDLIKVETPKRQLEYDYDSTGRRIHRRVIENGTLISSLSYLWSGNTVLREHDELNQSTRTYLRDDGAWEVIAHVDTAADGQDNAYYYLTDPAGATDIVVDERGTLVWSAQRTIYGRWTPDLEQIRVDSRFANQFWDEDAQLSYNNRRWYSPDIAAYISPDPALLEGTLNPRDYVPNPYTFIDPMGLMAHVHPGVQPDGNGDMPTQPDANGHADRPVMPGSSSFDNDGTYLLTPGHFATSGGTHADGTHAPGYHVATGSMRTESGSFPADVRRTVDRAGETFGCHSCGTKDPGTTNGHFIPDHQPPASQVRHAERAGLAVPEVRLYPHCLNCSRSQFRQAGRGSYADRAAMGAAQGQANAQPPT